jgi:putative pyruvate formate lyase activating enzyme
MNCTVDFEVSTINKYMSDCTLCPRKCHADRTGAGTGYCGQAAEIRAARAALHFWEEPCISGYSGSGTVFFSGCNMKCVFCQNHNIAVGSVGKSITIDRLSDIFFELQKKGACNINLVTGTHFIPQICLALKMAKSKGLHIPVVYNTSGYEEVSSLKMLEGLVDIYLPDMKYFSTELSSRYSNAPDYFEKASAAIAEMYRQTGSPVFNTEVHTEVCAASPYGQNVSLMKKGVIVRHLLLPGQTKDSKKVLRYLHEAYGNDIYVSIMNQYTPLPHASHIPELARRVSDEEYRRVLDFAERLGIENGFCQEGGTAEESFIPSFDYEGL